MPTVIGAWNITRVRLISSAFISEWLDMVYMKNIDSAVFRSLNVKIAFYKF